MSIETPARIAILGAGPIGLEAALYARYLGYDVDVYERGRVAENILRWGHVRMFTPFGLNRSLLGLAALKAQDPAWTAPADDSILTGSEFANHYLVPLSQSDLLVDSIHEQTEVRRIGRDGLLKGALAAPDEREARAEHDFRLLLRSAKRDEPARERLATADVVIDATGTYGNHNWLGRGGLPAMGEIDAAPQIEYGLPDVLGAQWGSYANRSILLVGSGHSAATTLSALAELAAAAPDTWITWVTCDAASPNQPQPIRVVPDDPLGERRRLAQRANLLAADDANHVTYWNGTSVEAIAWHADLGRFSVRLSGEHPGELEFDRIVANVGYRPNVRIFEELQIEQSAVTGASARLAAALAREIGLDLPRPLAIGADVLVNPEPDFYILGAKSFGRDSRFFISTGLEQVRELFTILGDRPDLNLYATVAGLC